MAKTSKLKVAEIPRRTLPPGSGNADLTGWEIRTFTGGILFADRATGKRVLAEMNR